MPTHVYCLLPASAEAPPAGLTGVSEAPVRCVSAAGIRAWVSEAAPVPDEAQALVAHARAHDAVAQAALGTGVTPLPLRYGQRFADDAHCVRSLERHAVAIRAALERVQGCVEMTTLVPLPHAAVTPPAPASPPGRAYLETLRARLAPEAPFLRSPTRRAIGDAVRDHVRGEAISVSTSDGTSFARLSHLVPRDAVPAYREAIASLDESLDTSLDASAAGLRTLGPHAPFATAHLDLANDA